MKALAAVKNAHGIGLGRVHPWRYGRLHRLLYVSVTTGGKDHWVTVSRLRLLALAVRGSSYYHRRGRL